eukprot:scaffold55195_cov43-Tisochrysis_lutea.AAC.1
MASSVSCHPYSAPFQPQIDEPSIPSDASIPRDLLGRLELPVEMALGRLTALGPKQTRYEVLINFDLGRSLGFAVPHAPTWLINLIVYMVAPSLWQRYVAALTDMQEDGNAHKQRIAIDKTGIYSYVQQITAQPLFRRSEKGQWWSRGLRMWRGDKEKEIAL